MVLVFLFEINSRCGSSLGSSGRFEILSNADFAALLSDPPRLPLPLQGPQFPAQGFETQTLSFLPQCCSSLTNSPESLCCLALHSTDPSSAAFPDFARTIPLPGSVPWLMDVEQQLLLPQPGLVPALISLCAPLAASFSLSPSLHLHFSHPTSCAAAAQHFYPFSLMEPWSGLGFKGI